MNTRYLLEVFGELDNIFEYNIKVLLQYNLEKLIYVIFRLFFQLGGFFRL